MRLGCAAATRGRLRGVLGAAKDKQDTHPPGDARDLAEMTVRDLDSNEIRLGDQWADRPAVLVWLRHYG